MDVGGDKYAIVCSLHGALVGSPNLPKAREIMKAADFCEECENAVMRLAQLTKEILSHP